MLSGRDGAFIKALSAATAPGLFLCLSRAFASTHARLGPVVMDPLQPKQLFAGRYRIEKFLAKGGYGAVYVAEQIETELRVALKVLWPHVLHSQDAVEKFRLEARVAGRVGSEHIVRVFDAGFDEATRMPFLVMELLRGEHLEAVVRSRGPLPKETLVEYFLQIASALDKAHGYVDKDAAPSPIIHRDLKPENLFLSHRETGAPIVKILDFGIAKVLSHATKVSQELRGTPLYMAHEQAMMASVSPRTDIWALGLIAFYLLTGRCYWKAATLRQASMTQLFSELLTLPLDPPSRRAVELGSAVVPSGGFDVWFARCVNRDPAARFSTAGECVAVLRSVLLATETQLSPHGKQVGAFEATEYAGGSQTVAAAVAAARDRVKAGAADAPAAPSEAVVRPSLGGTTGGHVAFGQTHVPRSGPPREVVFGLGIVLGVAVIGAGFAVAVATSKDEAPAVAAPAPPPPLTAPEPPIPIPPPAPPAPSASVLPEIVPAPAPRPEPVVAPVAPVSPAAPAARKAVKATKPALPLPAPAPPPVAAPPPKPAQPAVDLGF